MKELARVIKQAEKQVVNADQVLETFSKDILTNPIAALEWADKVYKAAAQKEVAQLFIKGVERSLTKCSFTEEEVLKQYIEYQTAEVLREATTVPMSSSASSNLTAVAKKVANAEFLDFIINF